MNKKNLSIIVALLALVLMISIASCSKSNQMAKQEQEQIQAYLTQNSTLNFVKKPSGLYYLEVVAGTGISPVIADSAYVKYTGKLLDGTIFDSNISAANPLGLIVGNNIPGFDEALTLMKQGGKATLLIPSDLAYGSRGNYYGGISGYTPLLFDVELVRVTHYTGK